MVSFFFESSHKAFSRHGDKHTTVKPLPALANRRPYSNTLGMFLDSGAASGVGSQILKIRLETQKSDTWRVPSRSKHSSAAAEKLQTVLETGRHSTGKRTSIMSRKILQLDRPWPWTKSSLRFLMSVLVGFPRLVSLGTDLP